MGIASDLTMDDCQLGAIYLLQGSSQLAKQGVNSMGHFIDLNDPEVSLGDKESPMEFIVCSHVKYWVDKDAETDAFIRKYNGVNEKEFPWEDVTDGKAIKRIFNISYIVIRPEDIAMGVIFPYEFVFRSSSLKIAKRLNTMFMKMANNVSNRQASWDIVLAATPILTENNKGDSWFAPSVKKSRDATPVEVAATKEVRAQFKSITDKILAEQTDKFTEAPKTKSDKEVMSEEF